MAEATFQNGNQTVTATTGPATSWEAGDKARLYFDVFFTSKRSPIDKLYLVISGDTRDSTITVGEKTYGYILGICCDSKTKRASAIEAVSELVSQLASE